MPSKEIRLLHLVKSMELGGIEKSTILYSNHLVHEIEFIGIFASQGFYDKFNFANEQIKRFSPPHPVWEKTYFIKNIGNILSIIRKNNITHIHYHHRIFIPFVFFIRLFFKNIKIFYTHHSVFNDFTNKLIIADKIIALNNTTKKDLSSSQQNKTIIIPHGVKVNNSKRNILNLPKRIGYFGRFVKGKGLISLLNDFKKIITIFPEITLLLIGDGELKQDIFAEISKLGIKDNVIIKAPILNEDTLYSHIDILILPSINTEGFGLTLIEAMSRGILVVVRNLPIFEGFIEDGYNGIVFNNNLAKKTTTVFSDSKYYNNMCLNGYATVKMNYSLKNILKKYTLLYNS